MGRLLGNKYTGEVKRVKYDHYPTPIKPVDAICKILSLRMMAYAPENILDPCAGNGVWGRTIKKIYTEAQLYGVDIDPNLEKPPEYDFWHTGDYINNYMANKKFDLIISNPPFKLAEQFIMESFKHITFGGTIAFMLPLGFMGSVGRYKRLFTNKNKPNHIIVSSRRIDFTGQGSPHTDIAMYIWYGYSKGVPITNIEWFDWEE